MKVIDIINQAQGKTLFSFEVLPPKKGEKIQSLFDCIDPLMKFNPAFIDVTYSREQVVEKELPDGSVKRVLTSKRPGTVGICAAIINRYNIPVVPHLICGGPCGLAQESWGLHIVDGILVFGYRIVIAGVHIYTIALLIGGGG